MRAVWLWKSGSKQNGAISSSPVGARFKNSPMKPSPCSWPNGAGNPVSHPPQRSTGAQRAEQQGNTFLSPFLARAAMSAGRAPARRHLRPWPTRRLPGIPRSLSKGPTYFRRAGVSTQRDSSSGALRATRARPGGSSLLPTNSGVCAVGARQPVGGTVSPATAASGGVAEPGFR